MAKPTPEEARALFRNALTEYVSSGWRIEIENEFDAVISKKSEFHWVGKLLIFILLLFVWWPLSIFYLIVVLVRGVTAKPKNRRLYIDEEGEIQLA